MGDFKKKLLNVGFSMQSNGESDQLSSKALFLICLTVIFLMMAVTVIVFFVAVKGPEEVLVPNVTGLQLEEGLLEMQVRELYPKIQLRYSDVLTYWL